MNIIWGSILLLTLLSFSCAFKYEIAPETLSLIGLQTDDVVHTFIFNYANVEEAGNICIVSRFAFDDSSAIDPSFLRMGDVIVEAEVGEVTSVHHKFPLTSWISYDSAHSLFLENCQVDISCCTLHRERRSLLPSDGCYTCSNSTPNEEFLTQLDQAVNPIHSACVIVFNPDSATVDRRTVCFGLQPMLRSIHIFQPDDTGFLAHQYSWTSIDFVGSSWPKEYNEDGAPNDPSTDLKFMTQWPSRQTYTVDCVVAIQGVGETLTTEAIIKPTNSEVEIVQTNTPLLVGQVLETGEVIVRVSVSLDGLTDCNEGVVRLRFAQGNGLLTQRAIRIKCQASVLHG
eukprot:TRINITY_DN603847_c0_g1_i1.p1 TRINITY_DN603847_c0_g1~~TRINITY_DN603847_c0_g1_i1.p1  ORF type:complete len:342 (-),score=59.89 TRINITY_DN603847_c0_g1_i1:176-1201(-)